MDDKHSKPTIERKPMSAVDPTARLDPKILELLVCPVTKKQLEYNETAQELISRSAGLAFPIKEGIPIMLVDHARQLDDPAHGSS